MEKTKGLVLGFAFLAIGIIVGGWMLRSGIVHFKDSERAVSVKGLAEREVKADRVIWPLVYKEVGDNLMVIYNSIESTNTKIINFLKSNGIAAEEITVAPANIIDMDAERYATQGIKYRYNVTAVLTVSTNKVDLVIGLMARQGDLLKQGVAVMGSDYQYSPQFQYTSSALNTIKPEMIEEATRNARTAADKFAHDSDSELGKIKSASQGQFSIIDRDANTPYIKTVRVVTSVEYYLKD
ncbi:MAG: SIMPL domain-containing protein [Alistipes sp.]|nr:SIMPL domain-containing protein [Alistipes sp.]